MEKVELILGIGIAILLIFALFTAMATINGTTLSKEWKDWKNAFKK